MRYLLIALSMLFCAAASAATQVSVYIGQPTVSIGVNLPVYPELVRVPGYPVYYAPRVNANIFFYDGLYWVYQEDRWYASTWYNGPWGLVDPEYVPVYVLRVPVRYYRQPPTYFRAWAVDAPPRWGEYWGATWESRRSGWDRWNRSSVPAAAPLPVYQRQYSGDRYPVVEQQRVILNQQYRYQPRDTVVRQYYTQQVVQTSVAPAQKRQAAQSRAATQYSSTQYSSAQLAPGQVKNQQGAQSAKEFAPGQVKKQQGAQSAKEFAPGQVKKHQATQTVAVAPPVVQPMNQQVAPAPRPNENARGHGKGKVKDDDEGQGQGQGRGEGQGKGHGKGHGKD